MPFIKTKINGKDCSIVDISKYARVYKDENGNIIYHYESVLELMNFLCKKDQM